MKNTNLSKLIGMHLKTQIYELLFLPTTMSIMIHNYYNLKDSLNNFLQITLRFSLKINKYFDFEMKLLFIFIVSGHMSDNIALHCYTTYCENETM
jgi:hypothetical protein